MQVVLVIFLLGTKENVVTWEEFLSFKTESLALVVFVVFLQIINVPLPHREPSRAKIYTSV